MQLLQQLDRLGGQRHNVVPALLHPLSRYAPQPNSEIELCPGRFAQLAGANTRQHQQLQAYRYISCMGVGLDGSDQLRQFCQGNVGIVLRRPGGQVLMQPFYRVVHRAPGDSCQVIYVPAVAPDVAGLIDDALLLHLAEKVHPFDRHNMGEVARAHFRENMKLQRADDAGCSAWLP